MKATEHGHIWTLGAVLCWVRSLVGIVWVLSDNTSSVLSMLFTVALQRFRQESFSALPRGPRDWTWNFLLARLVLSCWTVAPPVAYLYERRRLPVTCHKRECGCCTIIVKQSWQGDVSCVSVNHLTGLLLMCYIEQDILLPFWSGDRSFQLLIWKTGLWKEFFGVNDIIGIQYQKWHTVLLEFRICHHKLNCQDIFEIIKQFRSQHLKFLFDSAKNVAFFCRECSVDFWC